MVRNEIVIKDYITHVQMSKSRRAKYYVRKSLSPTWTNPKVPLWENPQVPKKYEKFTEYDKKNRLLGADEEPLIANPKAVGTPKLQKINGQAIYGGIHHSMRSKIVLAMKEYFCAKVKELQPATSFPVMVLLEFGYQEDNIDSIPDIDNLWIYTKTILDSLTQEGIIPDDNPHFIRGYSPQYRETTDMQLTIRIIDENERKSIQQRLGKPTDPPTNP